MKLFIINLWLFFLIQPYFRKKNFFLVRKPNSNFFFQNFTGSYPKASEKLKKFLNTSEEISSTDLDQEKPPKRKRNRTEKGRQLDEVAEAAGMENHPEKNWSSSSKRSIFYLFIF